MYLVVSCPNTLEVTLSDSPRLLTADPKKAFVTAQQIFNSDNRGFLAGIMIVEIEPEVPYPMDATRVFKEEDHKIVMCYFWKHPENSATVQKFYTATSKNSAEFQIEEIELLFTKCILKERFMGDGVRISVMSRHTLSDGVTADTRLKGKFDVHIPVLGPSPKLIGRYYRKEIGWPEFEQLFLVEIKYKEKNYWLRLIAELALRSDITLLCIEDTAQFCHRRILCEECRRIDPRLIVEHR